MNRDSLLQQLNKYGVKGKSGWFGPPRGTHAAGGVAGLGAGLAEVEREIGQDKEREWGVILDSQGNVQEKRAGGEAAVYWFVSDREKLNDKIYTHNHPKTGGSLNSADLKMAVQNNLREMRAVGIGADGKLRAYSLKRPGDKWRFRNGSRAESFADLRFDRANQGKSPEDVNRNGWDRAMRIIAQDIGADYSVSVVTGG